MKSLLTSAVAPLAASAAYAQDDAAGLPEVVITALPGVAMGAVLLLAWPVILTGLCGWCLAPSAPVSLVFPGLMTFGSGLGLVAGPRQLSMKQIIDHFDNRFLKCHPAAYSFPK